MPRAKQHSNYNHTNHSEPTPRKRSHKKTPTEEANAAFQPPKPRRPELGEQAFSMIRAEAEKVEARIARQRAARLAKAAAG